MRALVVSLALVAATATARADNGGKSPAVATTLSVAGSSVGPLLVLAGSQTHEPAIIIAGLGTMILGPSAGEWYSGKPVTWGLGLRAAGGALAVYGATKLCLWDECPPDHGLGEAMVIVGAVSFVGGTIADIAQAGPSARAWNAKHHVAIAPTVVQGEPGLAIAGTF